MGVEPFLVSSAIDGVLAQRLARVLCEKCKEAYTADTAALDRIGWDPESLADGPPVLYRAVGCRTCTNTGYRGRVALNEVMPITEELQRMTVDRKSSEDMRNVAIEQGMRTLREDGLAKVALGITSIEEVLRVVI
jgi:type IV pilus assembly protein PilB